MGNLTTLSRSVKKPEPYFQNLNEADSSMNEHLLKSAKIIKIGLEEQ